MRKHDIYAVYSDKIAESSMKGIIKIIKNKYEGQIDTGKMMSALLIKVQGPGIGVFNNCLVQKIDSRARYNLGKGASSNHRADKRLEN